MGCSGSKPEDASPSSSKKAGPGGRSLERENSSWCHRKPGKPRCSSPVAGRRRLYSDADALAVRRF